jgi:GDP-L-fucose synthase
VNPADRIYVAGHQGLVGSAIVRRLQHAGYRNLIVRSRSDLDLTDARAVTSFFRQERPQYVFLAAARVGGIVANDSWPADFIRDNLAIQLHVIDAAARYQVAKLLFLASSCVYPRDAPQPIREEYLLGGPLEPTNSAYAVAKIAGIETCRAYRRQYGASFITAMPANVYGPNDNFDLETSHVLPALIRRFHEARVAGDRNVTLWGSGTPRREFLHADDLADACVHLMLTHDSADITNVGWGVDISIQELATLVAGITGYTGGITWDRRRPDGTLRKLLDTTRLRELGWSPRIGLEEGVRQTYAWFRTHVAGQVLAEGAPATRLTP